MNAPPTRPSAPPPPSDGERDGVRGRRSYQKLLLATDTTETNLMAYLNENYLKLKAGYLFPEISRRVKAFCDANPEAARRLIRCGIGDVTEPLPAAVIGAM